MRHNIFSFEDNIFNERSRYQLHVIKLLKGKNSYALRAL